MSLSEVIRTWLLTPIADKLTQMEDTMAQTMQDLQDAISAQEQKISELGDTLADFATDFKAAIAALQAAIAAGSDTTEAVGALIANSDKLDTVIEGLKALDSDAEDISGQKTPPVPTPLPPAN